MAPSQLAITNAKPKDKPYLLLDGDGLHLKGPNIDAAIHDARVAFDCIALGENDRAHTSALTARVAIEAAVTALQAALAQTAGQPAAGGAIPRADF